MALGKSSYRSIAERIKAVIEADADIMSVAALVDVEMRNDSSKYGRGEIPAIVPVATSKTDAGDSPVEFDSSYQYKIFVYDRGMDKDKAAQQVQDLAEAIEILMYEQWGTGKLFGITTSQVPGYQSPGALTTALTRTTFAHSKYDKDAKDHPGLFYSLAVIELTITINRGIDPNA